jgi:hypothetical protein
MSSNQLGIRFSIRPDGARWRWAAIDGEVILGQGEAPSRAVAAALVIQHICRACRSDEAMILAEAA